MVRKIKKSDFKFLTCGFGVYWVCYFTPIKLKAYSCNVSDMELLDKTKNAQFPKTKDLRELRTYIKNNQNK